MGEYGPKSLLAFIDTLTNVFVNNVHFFFAPFKMRGPKKKRQSTIVTARKMEKRREKCISCNYTFAVFFNDHFISIVNILREQQ